MLSIILKFQIYLKFIILKKMRNNEQTRIFLDKAQKAVEISYRIEGRKIPHKKKNNYKRAKA